MAPLLGLACRLGMAWLLVAMLGLGPAEARLPDPLPLGGQSTQEGNPQGTEVHARIVPRLSQPAVAALWPAASRDSGPHQVAVVPSYHGALPQDSRRPVDRPSGTCTVTSKNDSGAGTLRNCLLNATAGDLILFSTSVFPPGSPKTITLATELPFLTVHGLTIDASDAGVILDGSNLPTNSAGFVLAGADDVTIRGLQIRGFDWAIVLAAGAADNTIGGDRSTGNGPVGQGNCIGGNAHGITIQDAGTSNNRVIGNLIGTNVQGTAADGNDIGVLLANGAANNQIGGARTPGQCDKDCNVISGSPDTAIVVQEPGTVENWIRGNFVGTNLIGSEAISNYEGITVGSGAEGTQIGGAGAGEGNLVSGNTDLGVWISGEQTTGNHVWGNLIGTDVSGAAALPNYRGILISGSTNNQIGGTQAGTGNVISGNEYIGLWIEHLGEPGNAILGNKIGTDIGGTQAVPNYLGILLTSATDNTIGGTVAGAANLISGNTTLGVTIESVARTSTRNILMGNRIGTTANGLSALPNGGHGIQIGFGSSENLIGGDTVGAGNLISGNGGQGIQIQNEDSSGNQVLGNRIGTNANGTAAIPNAGDGIVVISAPDTVIGGAHTAWTCSGGCNLISGNGNCGVQIQGESTPREKGAGARAQPSQNTRVVGNFIGTNLSGTGALPNGVGVGLSVEAVGNQVGDSSSGKGNLISGNGHDVEIIHEGTTGNVLLGNRIGTTANGMAALGVGELGVLIAYEADGNTVGGMGAGEGNLISGYTREGYGFGVDIQHAEETGDVANNQVLGNWIGTTSTGSGALPNNAGVTIALGPVGTLVKGNVIGGSVYNGVEIIGDTTTGSHIENNSIGRGADGHTGLPNGWSGIVVYNAWANTIGPENTIAYNQESGVLLCGDQTTGNTITQDGIYSNRGGQITYCDDAPHLAPPVLAAWQGGSVSGSACAECVVEVFGTSSRDPSSRDFLGSVTAGVDGSFALGVTTSRFYLSATATDATGTTSEFAETIAIPGIYSIYLPLVLRAAPQ